MSSKGLSKGKTESSRAMERLKNHNTSPPHPSDTSRSGAKSSDSRPGQRSKTTTSSRRQFSDDNSPERMPSRTRSLDEYHSCHYGNRSVSSSPRAPASPENHGSEIVPDHMIFQDPREREKETLGLEWNASGDGPSAQRHA